MQERRGKRNSFLTLMLCASLCTSTIVFHVIITTLKDCFYYPDFQKDEINCWAGKWRIRSQFDSEILFFLPHPIEREVRKPGRESRGDKWVTGRTGPAAPLGAATCNILLLSASPPKAQAPRTGWDWFPWPANRRAQREEAFQSPSLRHFCVLRDP